MMINGRSKGSDHLRRQSEGVAFSLQGLQFLLSEASILQR